jgi:hypothetical protein
MQDTMLSSPFVGGSALCYKAQTLSGETLRRSTGSSLKMIGYHSCCEAWLWINLYQDSMGGKINSQEAMQTTLQS